LEIEIDVKGSKQNAIIEVALVVESLCLFVVIKLNLNDTIFGVD
jgi:hypothetical protein